MKTNGKAADPPRGIAADAVYPLRTLERLLGWQRKTTAHAQKAGLRTVMFGRQKFVLGKWVLEFFEGLAQQESKE